jgi:hypothetical protein
MGLQIMHKDKTLESIANALKCTYGTLKHAAMLDGLGFKFIASVTGVEICDAQGELLGEIEIGLSSWTKVTDGNKHVSKAIKALVRKRFSKVINEIGEKLNAGTFPPPTIEQEGFSETDPINILPMGEDTALKFTELLTAIDGPTAMTSGMNWTKHGGPDTESKPVHLRAATKLGQPVKGSNDESVYHVIALSPDANVAVRIRGDMKLSLRIEGEEIGKYEAELMACGLGHAGSLHWSVHLNPKNLTMMKKAVGAILYSSGVPFTETLLDLEPLVGVGK